MTEALIMLVDSHVLPYGHHRSLKEWRETVLWTLDVNDVFHSNSDSLHDIYNRCLIAPSKILSKDSIFEIFCKHKDELQMPDKDVGLAFSCSKMTVIDEVDGGSRKYNKITFVEFLDFLGRLSQAKFDGSELADIPLAEKIEFLLSDLLEHFGHKLQKVHVEIHDETESDSDY